MKRITILLVALMFCFALTPSAHAKYPDRPITIIVPFGAGGDTDLVARLLATYLSEELKQNVLVQNIVGASGLNGISQVANSRADGYTLSMSGYAPLALHPHMRKVPYTLDSFTFLGRIVNGANILFVQKSSPWNTFDDMRKDIKANPDKYFWGSSGVGSGPYFAVLDLYETFGLQSKHVPFSGDAGALQAMAGNRVHAYSAAAALDGKYDIKPLLALSKERDPLLPNVPSVSEYGEDVFYSQWIPIFAPKGLPANVVKTLDSAIAKACANPKFIENMKKLSLAVDYLNAADATKFVHEQSSRNAEVVKRLMSK